MTALFEHSPWVEARADARPSSGDRHADLMAVLHDATPEEQLALIRAHPELAGKASVDGTLTEASGTPDEIAAASEGWAVLLPEQKLSADAVHTFRDELAAIGPVRFVRLNIIPDGGVSRLRLIGRVAR